MSKKKSAATEDAKGDLLNPIYVAEGEPFVWSFKLENSPGQVFLYLTEISPAAVPSEPIYEADIKGLVPASKRLAIPRRGLYILNWVYFVGGNWKSLVEVSALDTVVFRHAKSADGKKPKNSGHCVVVVS